MELFSTDLISDGNLLAYYRFNSGALTTDDSGNGNTLTNNNSVGETSSGKYGYAADFGNPNTTKYFSLGNGLGVDLSATASVTCWVKFAAEPAANTQKDIIDWRSSSGTAGRMILRYEDSGGTKRLYLDRAGAGITYEVTLGTTNWHHIVVIYNSTAVKVYLDNSLVIDTTAGNAAAGDVMRIGGSAYPIPGYMDDVAFFDRVLTTDEISELYVSSSPSASPSVSVSLSPSSSFSSSESLSISPSSSISLSPSEGYSLYSRGDYAALPANDNDLETTYTDAEEVDVATKDGVRVDQTATQEYMIHQFKNFLGTRLFCTLEWYGQSTLAPSLSPVYLQIYNQSTDTWETVDSDDSSGEDTNFTLTADIAELVDYRDASNVISCRVYQLAL